MTEAQIMQEIKRLSDDYLAHCNITLFSDEHLKSLIAFELLHQAPTPQRVIDELHKKHGFGTYKHLLKHQVLVMNRTPWWLWLIQAFFITAIFPISIPFLMIWSWVNRGTPNFLRTDGSIYLEKLLNLCRQAGVTKPSSPVVPSFPLATEINTGSNAALTLNQGVNMLARNPMPAGDGSARPAAPGATLPTAPDISLPPVLPTLEEDVNGMANIAEAFTQELIDNPTILVEAEVARTNGSAVFLLTPALQRVSDVVFLQRFDYAAAWTKPWQELDEFSSQVQVFRRFAFVRRPQKTDKAPMNIVPATGVRGRAYASGLALFGADSKSLLRKIEQNRGDGKTRERYHQALKAAKNNQEYADVMEALINFHHEGINIVEGRAHNYRPEKLEELRQEKAAQLNEYIDLLPENYHICSTTARTLEAYFAKVWHHLERHEIVESWLSFGKDEIFEKCEMKRLIETPFVQRCLPHFVAMWNQLMGLFLITGESGIIGVSMEGEAEVAQYHMRSALSTLQEHSLPDASTFEQECVSPLERMQAHVEEIFQQVPREQARYYAMQHFRDIAAWGLDERRASYRHEIRGGYMPIQPMLVERKRRAVAFVDAMHFDVPTPQQPQRQLTM